MLLSSLLLIPIIGILFIPICNSLYPNTTTYNLKIVALILTLINLFISFVIFIFFDLSVNQFQFIQEHYQISDFNFYLGIDGLSIYFVLLTTIIMPISILSN
jgi:NADH:ubiquinone oxidoreductase subunit 4 (subunit M)